MKWRMRRWKKTDRKGWRRMAKLQTPAMEKRARRNARHGNKPRVSTPGREAWKRLRRNKLAMIGMSILIVLILCAILAPAIIPYEYDYQDYEAFLQGPSAEHWFGTDNFGRDIFSRCIYGTRYSLPIGIISILISSIVGGTFGAIAAYYGGKADMLIMRFMDIYQSIPNMLLAIAISAAIGASLRNLIIAIALGTLPVYARVVRGALLTVKQKEYIEASRAIGATTKRQIILHMLPNCFGPIIVQMTFSVAAAILTASSLSFLGLGISAPAPEWGSMLNAGKQFLQTYPHMLIFPGLMIAVTVLSLNLFGDGLRDALDPKLK